MTVEPRKTLVHGDKEYPQGVIYCDGKGWWWSFRPDLSWSTLDGAIDAVEAHLRGEKELPSEE